MRRAIALTLAAAWLFLLGIDRLWPIWPMHAVALLLGVAAASLAGLAVVAAGRR